MWLDNAGRLGQGLESSGLTTVVVHWLSWPHSLVRTYKCQAFLFVGPNFRRQRMQAPEWATRKTGSSANSWYAISVTGLLLLHTPWSRVLLEKLTGFQLVKKFPAFYGTRRFITAVTSARHLSLSWATSIQSTSQHPTKLATCSELTCVYRHVSRRHGKQEIIFLCGWFENTVLNVNKWEGKAALVFNCAPRHESAWRSGGTTRRTLGTIGRWEFGLSIWPLYRGYPWNRRMDGP